MNMYIDESGSLTQNNTNEKNKFFIITILLVEDTNKLKKVYKRFVKKYISQLKQLDRDNKMFDGEKFIEIKGSMFNCQMKKNFLEYFCKNNLFKILYIKIDNTKAEARYFTNIARTFNLILKQALEQINSKGLLTDRNWMLNIDERNVRTGTKLLLKEHLITELSTGKNIVDNIEVTYFDSSQSKLIQLADVFSNIYYSDILTNHYCTEISKMIEDKYIIDIFNFPI